MEKKKKIVIVGGGFAGVSAAKHLARHAKKLNFRVILISDQKHFEYHGALYRTATGETPMEVCFPLREILPGGVEIVHAKVSAIDRAQKKVQTREGDVFYADTLVLALGAQTTYFDVPGLAEHSHGMKTIAQALELKRHVHETIAACTSGTQTQKICGGRFVIVGGGATGVELAGDLAQYARTLAQKHNVDPMLIQIELIEAQDRILPTLTEGFSRRMQEHLTALGVDVRIGTAITASDAEAVYLPNAKIGTYTIVWTAGVRAHDLIEQAGFELGKGKKALVCAHLKAKDERSIYIIGDSAQTMHSGMAQVAMDHGRYAARAIIAELRGRAPSAHKDRIPIYAIPAGRGWAGAFWGSHAVYGKLGWAVRRLVDLIVFVRMLPLAQVPSAFFARHDMDDLCKECQKNTK